MCTSSCSGSCIKRLKENEISSEKYLTETNELLNKIALHGPVSGIYKNISMNEIINLKIEARKLLDEVNNHNNDNRRQALISGPSFYFDNIFDDNTFKEKLNHLKHRINALETQNFATNNT